MKRTSAFLLLTVHLVAGGVTLAESEARSLLSNGDFETATRSADWPDHWPHPEGASWESEGGNHFLRLRPARADQLLTVYRVVHVRPEHKAYEFRFRVRYANVKRGKESWHDGRVLLDFKDAKGKQLKPGPRPPTFTGTSDGWKERTLQFVVPEGATKLEVMPALFKVAGGTLDLDDLKLAPITDEATIDRLREEAVPVPDVPVAVRGPLPPPAELRVVGNQLQTADGKQVWLQGVNVPSLDWSNTGDHVLRSIVVAVEDWRANVIRLPLHDDRWFGRAAHQKDRGESYRQLVGQAVEAASTRGAYLVLDLHRYRAPTEEHAAFWRDAAAHFKNNPAVLFDLLNEPHDVSWDTWRNGGVVAGGVGWSYDLSGVLKGYALHDPGGNGIVYATHVYNWKSGWQKSFLDVAAKYPILVGEAGCDVERLSFIPAKHQEDPATWAPDMIAVIQKYKLHWTAWSFHPRASPGLLAGWDYQPTPYWGEPVRAALRGRQFQLNRLR